MVERKPFFLNFPQIRGLEADKPLLEQVDDKEMPQQYQAISKRQDYTCQVFL